jgi:hypothetical protein
MRLRIAFAPTFDQVSRPNATIASTAERVRLGETARGCALEKEPS